MSDAGTCLKVKVAGPVATVTLARPEVRNALDETLIGTLAQAFQKLGVAEVVRVVVLEGEGKDFCAGADVTWMRRAAQLPHEDNLRDAMQLAVMADAVDRCPKPVIGIVHGAVLGGGAGLAAACDVVLASEDSFFSLPEVRLGLEPGLMGRQLVDAIGLRAARRYCLTGERFDAREAARLGLVHAVIAADRLAEARDRVVEACLKGAPGAQAATKELLRVLADAEAGPDLMRLTAQRLADQRAGAEGREGLDAFVEKRKPAWQW
ncbi:enoyl-CoA hydratase-related protein [Magnetospirillum sp. UT-4]|uniref:enoyl-CoA hydratase-related protein n=1 Tax=Magnetospirillum sp. UT-4 TaxID=2681467 RepID=UPI00137D8C8A|nr:enoyl-CoA hydratase-related protein [Magnetospirillum sp. UT-4]CAA7618376.1 putative Enoyl-CoA hydratase/carnithine racemase [Magnetospirillum sp. UT-4]